MRFDKGNCRKKRVFSQPDVSAPCAVCDLRRRVFSAKRKYDKKTVIPLNSQMAQDVCWQIAVLFIPMIPANYRL